MQGAMDRNKDAMDQNNLNIRRMLFELASSSMIEKLQRFVFAICHHQDLEGFINRSVYPRASELLESMSSVAQVFTVLHDTFPADDLLSNLRNHLTKLNDALSEHGSQLSKLVPSLTEILTSMPNEINSLLLPVTTKTRSSELSRIWSGTDPAFILSWLENPVQIREIFKAAMFRPDEFSARAQAVVAVSLQSALYITVYMNLNPENRNYVSSMMNKMKL